MPLTFDGFLSNIDTWSDVVVPWLRATLLVLLLGGLLTQALIVPIGVSQALSEYPQVAGISAPMR